MDVQSIPSQFATSTSRGKLMLIFLKLGHGFHTVTCYLLFNQLLVSAAWHGQHLLVLQGTVSRVAWQGQATKSLWLVL
jgi:hypothetical protein